MPVFNNMLAGASGGAGGAAGYEIERSLRFNSGDSAHLSRAVSSAGNRKTFTWSGWIKRTQIDVSHILFESQGGVPSTPRGSLAINELNIFRFAANTTGSSWNVAVSSNAVLRDCSAFYHLVLSVDTTQGTAADRLKLYINGAEVSYNETTYPGQNVDLPINQALGHRIGSSSNNSNYLNGYLADVHFIDGQALAPTDFGETDDNGVWQPKKFGGTYGPLVDQSQTWSSAFTDSSGSFASGYPATYAFDGITTAARTARASASNTTATFAPATDIAYTSKVEVWTYFSGSVSLNGGSAVTVSNDQYWRTIATGSGTLDTLTFISSASNVYLGGIRIDGKYLIDSGVTVTDNSFHLDFADNSSNAALGTDTSGNSNTWTVNNLEAAPGAATTVSSATGALPVYNTTDSQGKVKGTGTRTDSNSSYLVLAVPFDAGNTVDVSNSINTNSTTKSFTTSGSFASNASNIFYGSSTDFNGSSSLSTTSTSSDFTFGTGDFTIEYWAQYDDISAGNSQVGDFQTSTTSGGLSTSSSTGIKNNFYPSGQLNFSVDGVTGGSISGLATGTWYHIAIVRENGSVRLYKDGILQATTSNARDVTATYINIGGYYSTSYLRNGQMQDFRVYKGVAKYTSNFTLVGPGNVALQAGTDSLVDTPTNGTQTDTGAGGEVVGNYATLNPLLVRANLTYSQGNLQIASAAYYRNSLSTISLDGGKWYIEATCTTISSNLYNMVGVVTSPVNMSYPGSGVSDDGFSYFSGNGKITVNTVAGTETYATWTTGDIIGLAYDSVTRKCWVSKNGVWQNSGNPASGTGSIHTVSGTKEVFYAIVAGASGVMTANFGQRAFAYTAPSGYKCLCTTNLPEPTIADGSKYFDAKLYTGDSNNTQDITSYNFSPDLVWQKIRSQAGDHALTDTVRGVDAGYLQTEDTDAEKGNANDGVSAFLPNGFTAHNGFNNNGLNWVAWAWDAGTSTVTNNDGSIASQVRANPSAGFSIVSYTGNGSTSSPSIGHGLNAALGMVIIKNRDGSQTYPDWYVKHKDIGDNYNTRLNLTAGRELATGSGAWYQGGIGNLTSSSVISFVTGSQSSTGNVNTSGNNYIAYCFAPVEGYSAMGSYQGNSSAQGPFIYTGFKVAWILCKKITNTDSNSGWHIYDNARNQFNTVNNFLLAGKNYDENKAANNTAYISDYNFDFLSNGFRVTHSSNNLNETGSTYIYLAFAEHPFKTARAR